MRLVFSIAWTKTLAAVALTALVPSSQVFAKQDGNVYAPPPSMRIDGVPPIQQSLAADIAPYGDFQPTRFVGWHPAEQDMMIVKRAGATAQIFLLADPLGKPLQLTRGKEPVRGAWFEPKRGEYILFARDVGGDEATQIYRLDPKTLE
jgi:hypothetical protein